MPWKQIFRVSLLMCALESVGVLTIGILPSGAAPPADAHHTAGGAGDPTDACGFANAPTILARPSGAINANGWTAGYGVTPANGLGLYDIRLKDRYMAESIETEYIELETTKSQGSIHVPLTFAGAATSISPRCRLVNFTTQNNSVMATYCIDQFPWCPPGAGYSSCLRVDQEYVFGPRNTDNEPSKYQDIVGYHRFKGFDAARLFPRVKYRFYSSNTQDEDISVLRSAQRIRVAVNGTYSNQCMVIQDTVPQSDGGPGGPDVISAPIVGFSYPGIRLLHNEQPGDNDTSAPAGHPLEREALVNAVKDGGPGDFDNCHFSYAGAPMELPVTVDGPPGCNECMHLHWRWDKSLDPLNEYGFGAGRPLILPASKQTVRLALVNADTETVHGQSEANLMVGTVQGQWSVQNELLADPVLWYLCSATTPTDTFFDHGVFFGYTPHSGFNFLALSSDYPTTDQTGDVKLPDAKVGDVIRMNVNITYHGDEDLKGCELYIGYDGSLEAPVGVDFTTPSGVSHMTPGFHQYPVVVPNNAAVHSTITFIFKVMKDADGRSLDNMVTAGSKTTVLADQTNAYLYLHTSIGDH